MARGKGRYTPSLNQGRRGWGKNGNTAARPVGHFKSK